MEVHHHSHPSHEKKNWKSYFWEFLMLFLAVCCGFIAEYQLEHKIERDREIVYIHNLCQDLQADVSNFSEYDKSTNEYMSNIDSILMLMKEPGRDSQINKLYYRARKATMNSNNFLNYNSRTFEQMKHSGHLRLIRKQVVADSISKYYFTLQRIDLQNSILKDRISEYMHEVGNVFDAQVLFQIFKDKQVPTSDSLKLMTNDPRVINAYLVSSQYYYGARVLQKEICIERKKRAESLLELIKKEYCLHE